ncbi:MAG: B12-binding domain-containing radical SAM protein [Chloroflexota bacterium]|nr:B12-binding domain-containing radical SAM protein [Chloroflexota bacterium]
MRVLLVYPEIPDTFWSFKHALRFIRKKASFPPLGLLTVAPMLPESWDLRLVDMNVERLTDRDLEWADYVFVSAMVVQREGSHRLIERCQSFDVKVVAGGPLFLSEHQDFPLVDYFVLDEAEATLPRFLNDLEEGHPRRVYKREGDFPDITKSPTPMWELVNLDYYSSMCIQYSRGCPFNCDFCNITAMLGHRPRCKTPEQIIAELDALYELGWRGGVFFVDDNFIGNKRKLKGELLPALIEWRKGKRGFSFQTEVSINMADDPVLMDLMAQAGFEKVFVGIETPDEEGLAQCNKRQNEGRDLVADVKKLQRAGFEVQGGFIVGFDSDEPSIFQRQIDFIQNSGIVTAMVGLLQAPPGTRLRQRLKEEGRLLGKMSGQNTDNTMNFVPKMDAELLHEGYYRILNSIYSPKAYYKRVRTFLQEYKKNHVAQSIVSWQEVLAFFRSIFKLGIKGKERLEYWKLLFWTLFRRPRLFPEAVTMAIYGFHFRRVFELYMSQRES